MRSKRRKYARIPFILTNKIPLLKQITGIRFKRGFSRLSEKQTIFDGRFFWLSHFVELEDGDFSRQPMNVLSLLQKNLPSDLVQNPLPDTYSFLILTDPHITQEDTRLFERLPNICIQSDAFLIINGDATRSGSPEQLDLLTDLIQYIPLPVYPVVGNHDIYFHRWSLWQKVMGKSIYRIDSGTTTFFVLDSANGLFGSTQLDWLEEQLKTVKTGSHLFIFSHCNFFIPRHMIFQQFYDFKDRSRFIKLCKGKVEAVFTGHSHKQYSHIAEGVPYINLEDFRDKGTYCRVHVSPKGFHCTYGSVADVPEYAIYSEFNKNK